MSRKPRPVQTLSRIVMLCCAVVAVLLTVTARAADDDKADKPGKGPAEFKSLKYRLVGPAVGGRVSRVSGVPGNPLVYYAATASGGVWKSEDGGIDWKPIFDDQPISSTGSIAVAPSDPNVLYVGSGEANIRGNVADGNGIYKSTDAGKTWNHVWKQVGAIGTMVVHPKNPDIAFAAVLGRAFGPNPERGVYRTKDGGGTWEQVLKVSPQTGAIDVTLDVKNPNTLLASMWTVQRAPWTIDSGSKSLESGIFRSTDGGNTWQKVTRGLPQG
ncbi:MAG TPA: glycosyl hydrolase, partial [Candidatus Polarisedimenticolia bacterium]|nr:glycosyl hydrolase [Candidatus Polarisedimenticolia bacterium]